MPTRPTRRRLTTSGVVSFGLVLAVSAAGCSRSSSSSTPTGPSASAAASSKASGTSAAGDFGTLSGVCGPGTPSASSERGLLGNTIRIGTLSDAGSSASPGLEQEFFDVGTSFVKWCNAAGGINGRKIVLDQLDAKLTEGAARVITACQNDFMLVGGGNAFDSLDVKPRLACKLGQIPAYTVSPEAGVAGLQVQPDVNVPTQYLVGPSRLLAQAYPVAQQGLGIGSSTLPSLLPLGKRAQQAYTALGYKVSVVQSRPPAVDNFRPYFEQMKGDGAKAYLGIGTTNPATEIQAIRDVGWDPAFIAFERQAYDPQTVAAAKAVKFPPTYIGLPLLPYELSDQFPVLKQAEAIVDAQVKEPKLDFFTTISFSAWLLWAKSASECGSTLTQDCVLSKAGSFDKWTAGGLIPAVSTIAGKQRRADCIVMMRVTPDGFVYDEAVTKPTDGVYNCDPKNVADVKSYQ